MRKTLARAKAQIEPRKFRRLEINAIMERINYTTAGHIPI